MRLKWNNFILLFVSLLLCSCSKTKVESISVSVGNVKNQFVELAKTHTDKSYVVSMPFSGRLLVDQYSKSIFPGTRVHQGQILGRISDQSLAIKIEHAKKVLASSRANLEASESEAAIYKKNLDRYQTDAMKKTISKNQYEKIELSYVKAKAQMNKAIEDGDAAQKQLDLLLYQKTRCLLKSPVDGVVLNVYQHVGGTLNTGVAIFEIGDAKQMTIESDVLSDRVHDMRVGQTVSVGLSRSKFIYSGTISRINPKGFMEVSPLGVKERRVPVLVDLTDKDSFPAVLGARLYVRFTLNQYHGLLLPYSALMRSSDGSYYVYKIQEGVLHKQSVSVGVEGSKNVAITAGLKEHDVVVLSPRNTMKEGASVVPKFQ